MDGPGITAQLGGPPAERLPELPSEQPSRSPAASASRSARPAACSRSAATAASGSASVRSRHRASCELESGLRGVRRVYDLLLQSPDRLKPLPGVVPGPLTVGEADFAPSSLPGMKDRSNWNALVPAASAVGEPGGEPSSADTGRLRAC